MPTDYECAYYASEVYTEGGGQPLPGWEKGEVNYQPNNWNLGMATYYHPESRSLVISFRGTEGANGFNWISNLGLFWGQIPPPQAQGDGFAAEQHDVLLARARAQGPDHPDPPVMGMGVGGVVADAFMGYGGVGPGLPRLMGFQMGKSLASSDGSVFVDQYSSETRDFLSSVTFNAGAERIGNDFLNSAARRESIIGFEAALKAAMDAAIRDNIASITVVGHSLGGAEAELCSCRLKKLYPNSPIAIKAVTIDSPGIGYILEMDAARGRYSRYALESYDHIKSYLSAPNIVNTCQRHVGEVFRVYVPHVEGGLNAAHVAQAMVGTVARAAVYVGAFFSPPAALAGAAALISSYVMTIVKNAVWTHRQHARVNILNCFLPVNGVPECYSKMTSWPCLPRILEMPRHQLEAFVRALRPFPADAPGIRTLFYEDLMNERQVSRLPNYEVEIHYGELPDWVRDAQQVEDHQGPAPGV